MANALSQVRSALQPKAGNPSPASAVLRIVAVDGTSLLHAVRMAVDSVRALKLPVTRMGPFDDSRIAETGFFVAGPPSALAKLKKVVEERAAKAGIPILVSEHKVKNEPGSVAEQADSETGQMVEGGLGSGHFAHKGRMGKRGGSLPSASGRTLDGASVDKLQGNVAYGRKETASLEKLTQAADTWAMTLSGAEKYSLGEYMAASYRNVNTALRHPERHPTPGTMEHIQHISEALSRAALPHDVVVYRGITPGSAKGLSALAVGAEIHDKAFLSTSVSKYRAASFSGLGSDSGIVVRIRLPKGTHAALVSAMEASIGGAIKVAKGRHLDEGEILVASGARLRVTSGIKRVLYGSRLAVPIRTLNVDYVGSL